MLDLKDLEKAELKIVEIQKNAAIFSESAIQKSRSEFEIRKKTLLGFIEIVDFCEQFLKESESVFSKKLLQKMCDLLARSGVQQIIEKRVVPGRVKVIETRIELELEEGTVLSVCRKGFQLGDLILRPLEVISSRK